MAIAKHKFQKIVLNPANQKLVDFLDELQKMAEDAFEIAAHAIIEQFIYAKIQPHLNKSINQAHLENGSYEKHVTHLEKELELNGLEAPGELQINTASQHSTNINADRPKPTCHHCKNQDITEISFENSEKKLKTIEKNLGNKNSGANNKNANSKINKINNKNNNHKNMKTT